jgi:hypothetical protein
LYRKIGLHSLVDFKRSLHTGMVEFSFDRAHAQLTFPSDGISSLCHEGDAS